MRTSIVLELLTTAGTIAMAVLLYTVLGHHNQAVALVALGLWIAEAIFLAVKTLALYAVLDVSQGHTGAETLATSSDQALGSFALRASQHAGDIDMLFFCLGAVLWYFLLVQSRIVPRLLALWGLLAVPWSLSPPGCWSGIAATTRPSPCAPPTCRSSSSLACGS
jgi:hypothetical protein